MFTYLTNRINYVKQTKKSATVNTEQAPLQVAVVRTEEEELTDLHVLRTTVINDNTIGEIETKLRLTSDYRHKMLQDKTVDLRTAFPYFFFRGELV